MARAVLFVDVVLLEDMNTLSPRLAETRRDYPQG